MEFRYVGPLVGPVEVPAFGLRLAPGESVEVTGDAAKALQASGDYERTDKPSRHTHTSTSTTEKES